MGDHRVYCPKIGCMPQTFHEWVKRAEVDAGLRDGVTTADGTADEETRTRGHGTASGQRTIEAGQRVFRQGGTRPPFEELKRFIDQHRHMFGVEPICQVLQMAPLCYWRHAARRRRSELRSARAQRDDALAADIQRVWHANWQVYGAHKVWLQMSREGMAVARCTVERLMGRLGLRGVVRGKAMRTTSSDSKAPCPLDRVNRVFKSQRPNQLWVSDFTCVSTWQGWLYVAFVIDVFARRFVGWRVSRTMQTDFVLDALEPALYERRPAANALIHHSDRGSKYLSIRYSQRLAEAGIQPFVGSRGDSCDNALAETINGLYKAELIHRRGPWKSWESVELATLQWVHWFNHTRLLTPIGGIPPAEAEANYWRQLANTNTSAEVST